jgi:hypothetical protein
MNVQATLKTMLVVLGIGALTGFSQWRHTGGGAPAEVRAKLAYNDCMEKRKEAAFRENPLSFGRDSIVQQRQFEADCKFESNGGGIQLGKEAPKPTGIVEAGGVHYAPNGQIQTQSREECLTQIEGARKRSPGGLNPEWEKSQKAYCQTLYSNASN